MLKMLDMHGIHYSFTLFGKHYNFGGVMTLLTISCFILSIWYFGQDFFIRRNPHYINEKNIEKSYPIYQVSNQNLIIAISITANGESIDYSNYFNIEIVYNNITSVANNTKDIISIEFRDFKLIDYTAMRLSTSQIFNKNMICLDLDNIVLGGYNNQDWYYSIDINVFPYFNSTANNKSNCLSYDKVRDFLYENEIYLSILTNSYYTELADFENPLKLHLFDVFALIDPKIGKYNEIYYKDANIKYDMGILTD